MAPSYTLKFSKQVYDFDVNTKLYEGDFQGSKLNQVYSYNRSVWTVYENDNGTWTIKSRNDNIRGNFVSFVDINGKGGKENILVRTNEGLVMYEYAENSQIKKVFTENSFHELYDWNDPHSVIQMGYFYPEKVVGILTYREQYGLVMYSLPKKKTYKDDPLEKINPLYYENELLLFHKKHQVDYSLHDIDRTGQQSIILRDRGGLKMYKFKKNFTLETVLKYQCCFTKDPSKEKIYFADIIDIHKKYKEILYFNTSGLFVYQYNSDLKSYDLLSFHAIFSEKMGWTVEHMRTVYFKDITFGGRQDMLFTGPNGISAVTYDEYNKDWISLLDNSKLTIKHRNSKILLSVKKKPVIFSSYKNELYTAEIVPLEERQMEIHDPIVEGNQSGQQDVPKVGNLAKGVIHAAIKSNINIKDILHSVDKVTGKLSFQLPLIDLKFLPMKLYIHYDSRDVKLSNTIGVGWGIRNEKIFVDYRSSEMPVNQLFCIYLENELFVLNYDSDESSKEILSFQLFSEKYGDTKFLYYKLKEKWEVTYRKVKRVYGIVEDVANSENAVEWSVGWLHWRGRQGLVDLVNDRFPVSWYLTKQVDESDEVMVYNYDAVNVEVKEETLFTQEVYLMDIKDNIGNMLSFSYAEKEKAEYEEKESDNSAMLNLARLKRRYLESIKINSSSFYQVVELGYTVNNHVRRLVNITELNYFPAMYTFSYNNEDALIEIKLANGSKVKFSYTVLAEKFTGHANKVKGAVIVPEDYKFSQADDYTVIGSKTQDNKITIHVLNPEMTQVSYSSFSTYALTKLPLFSGINFYLIVRDKYFALTIKSAKYHKLCLFRWINFRLQIVPKCYHFKISEDVFQFGNDFIIAADTSYNTMLIEWDYKREKWHEMIIRPKKDNSVETSVVVAVYNNMFTIYDDHVLQLWFHDYKHKWTSKVIGSKPHVLSENLVQVQKLIFDLKPYPTIYNYVKSNIINLRSNIILMNTLKFNGTLITTKLKLLLFNNDIGIVKEWNFNVDHEDLSDIRLELDGSEFNTTYRMEKFEGTCNNSYNIVLDEVLNVTGSLSDTFIKENPGKMVQEEMRLMAKRIFKHSPPIDFKGYYGHIVKPNLIICGKHSYTFTGGDWVHTNLNQTEKITLGKYLEIIKIPKMTTYHLQNFGSLPVGKKISNVDLKVKELEQISVNYPSYLAFSVTGNPLNVIEFNKNGYDFSSTYTLLKYEHLSYYSNYKVLITEVAINNNSFILLFRPLYYLNRYQTDTVVDYTMAETQSDITGSVKVRQIKYQFIKSSQKLLKNHIYYEHTSVIPGNNQKSFGWIDYYNSKFGTTVNLFTGDGNWMKTLSDKDVNNKLTADDIIIDVTIDRLCNYTAIYDKSGTLEVAQFFPNSIENNDVSYYGFENYERNIIGLSGHRKWIFNEKNIRINEFSYSGQNCLHLIKEPLVGEFYVGSVNKKYIASSWLRLSKKPTTIILSNFKAILSNHKTSKQLYFLSEIKWANEEWNYVEIIIDLPLLSELDPILTSKKMFNNATYHDLQIKVIVEPEPDISIDVDHIRFSPVDSKFEAKVYDARTRKLKQIIQNNGLIRRFLLNDFQERFSVINDLGQIEYITSYTNEPNQAFPNAVKQPRSIVNIKPLSGFYEEFSLYSFKGKWIIREGKHFLRSPGKIQHNDITVGSLELDGIWLNNEWFGVRFACELLTENSWLSINGNLKFFFKDGHYIVEYHERNYKLPYLGEVVYLVRNHRLILYLANGLYFDEHVNVPITGFKLDMRGNVTVEDMLIFNNQTVEVDYFNELNEKIQRIQMIDSSNTSIQHYLYDDIGRQAIITKRIILQRLANQSVLAFYHKFVNNDNHKDVNSIWKTGYLMGDAVSKKILGDHDFYRLDYETNPLSEVKAIGYPGKQNSITSSCSQRFNNYYHDNSSITYMYPIKYDYKIKLEHRYFGMEYYEVRDNKGNMVAQYIETPGYSALLTTYVYHAKNNLLLKILPPLYHDKVNTYDNFQSVRAAFEPSNDREYKLQKQLGTIFKYNENGKIIELSKPDCGIEQFIYNRNGLLKFILYYNYKSDNIISSVVYFDYDRFGRITSAGILSDPHQFNEKENVHNIRLVRQEIIYSDSNPEFISRGSGFTSISYNELAKVKEEILDNKHGQTLIKHIKISSENLTPPQDIIAIKKKYVGGNIIEIEYPIAYRDQTFRLTYNYDTNGLISAIGIPSERKLFASYNYDDSGLLKVLNIDPMSSNNAIIRHYRYSDAGYITEIDDNYLSISLNYSSCMYSGKEGFGDGTIVKVKYIVKWNDFAKQDDITLNESSFVSGDINVTQFESKLCFNALKTAGYIDPDNHQAKIYFSSLEIQEFPILCTFGIMKKHLAHSLGRKGYPKKFGHIFDYGNNFQLTKAMYFVGESDRPTLQSDTLKKEIGGIDDNVTKKIWDALKKGEFIQEQTNRTNTDTSHVKQGKSFMNPLILKNMTSIKAHYNVYKEAIYSILISVHNKKGEMKFDEFLQYYNKWQSGIAAPEIDKNDAKLIWEMLQEMNYLKLPFNEEFTEISKQFVAVAPKVVQALYTFFSTEIGEAEFDVEASGVDANGNHGHFINGFNRYNFVYHSHSNRIEQIVVQRVRDLHKNVYQMSYDNRGNVVSALHKEIERITYDAFLNKPIDITVTDKTVISFAYDSKGDRVMKRVVDQMGRTTKEIYYIRDDLGRCLVEKQLLYIERGLPPHILITAYIYGQNGLIGFIRRDEFYGIISDPQGSTRLVVRNGEVVAAYDYMPYGKLMRIYGSNPEGHVQYRYLGQEWDQELKLYNYNGRLYDPDIGRFLQPDPTAQDASPYHYQGYKLSSDLYPEIKFQNLFPNWFGRRRDWSSDIINWEMRQLLSEKPCLIRDSCKLNSIIENRAKFQKKYSLSRRSIDFLQYYTYLNNEIKRSKESLMDSDHEIVLNKDRRYDHVATTYIRPRNEYSHVFNAILNKYRGKFWSWELANRTDQFINWQHIDTYITSGRRYLLQPLPTINERLMHLKSSICFNDDININYFSKIQPEQRTIIFAQAEDKSRELGAEVLEFYAQSSEANKTTVHLPSHPGIDITITKSLTIVMATANVENTDSNLIFFISAVSPILKLESDHFTKFFSSNTTTDSIATEILNESISSIYKGLIKINNNAFIDKKELLKRLLDSIGKQVREENKKEMLNKLEKTIRDDGFIGKETIKQLSSEYIDNFKGNTKDLQIVINNRLNRQKILKFINDNFWNNLKELKDQLIFVFPFTYFQNRPNFRPVIFQPSMATFNYKKVDICYSYLYESMIFLKNLFVPGGKLVEKIRRKRRQVNNVEVFREDEHKKEGYTALDCVESCAQLVPGHSLPDSQGRSCSVIYENDCKGMVAVSTASKNSPAINKLFSWIVTHVDRLLPQTIGKTFQNLLKHFESNGQSYCSNDMNNINYPQFQLSSTILLADVLLAKKCSRKLYIARENDYLAFPDALHHALNIVDAFENQLVSLQLSYGIDVDIDFVNIQKEVFSKLTSKRFDEIAPTLKSYFLNMIALDNYYDDKVIISGKQLDSSIGRYLNRYLLK